MENLLKINGQTYVKINTTNDDLFTEIYYVNRREKGGEWQKGIAFLNLEDAQKYAKQLEEYLNMITTITKQTIYAKL